MHEKKCMIDSLQMVFTLPEILIKKKQIKIQSTLK